MTGGKTGPVRGGSSGPGISFTCILRYNPFSATIPGAVLALMGALGDVF